MADLKDKLLDAALAHVPFDGWSEASFEAAVAESELEPALAYPPRALPARGGGPCCGLPQAR